ncbi:MAG TPA: integrase core domain-containing protein [Terriglobales bacterium]|jgi:excinuclease UvrABC helicase subunit UvrB|nr:integrase core domain-containing protein [Terriglobales bacterium]
MDIERIIDDIEQLQEMFEAPDIRPLSPSDISAANRRHKSLKSECIRPGTPLSLEDAKRLIQQYVDRYNHVRLHSAIGYVTPADMLTGQQAEIHTQRDRKLEEARQQRQRRRRQATYADADGLNPAGQCKTLQLDVPILGLLDKM